jgi:hypothetical protein
MLEIIEFMCAKTSSCSTSHFANPLQKEGGIRTSRPGSSALMDVPSPGTVCCFCSLHRWNGHIEQQIMQGCGYNGCGDFYHANRGLCIFSFETSVSQVR